MDPHTRPTLVCKLLNFLQVGRYVGSDQYWTCIRVLPGINTVLTTWVVYSKNMSILVVNPLNIIQPCGLIP